MSFYAARGFRVPAADTGGPDTQPDIYVKGLKEGVLGVAFARTALVKESFLLVAPDLDRGEQGIVDRSLNVTVAHELFHLIQYAYMPTGDFAGWLAEGTAVAMQRRVFPAIEDATTRVHLESWLKEPWLPIHDAREQCLRCYGSAWWWEYLERRSLGLIKTYLERLAASQQARRGFGLDALAALLRGRKLGTLADAYTAFSVVLFRRGLDVGAVGRVVPKGAVQATSSFVPISPLSAQYVPLDVLPGARGVSVVIAHPQRWKPGVRLLLGGPKGRVVSGRMLRSKKATLVQARFRGTAERKQPILVVSGAVRTVERYRLVIWTYRQGPAFPAWIGVTGKLP